MGDRSIIADRIGVYHPKKDRRISKCVTIPNRTIDIVDEMGIGENWSKKLEWLIHDYARIVKIFVVYETDEQREKGMPTILRDDAERWYASSAFLKGFDPECTLTASRSLEEIDALKALFDMQIIDEPGLFDVWLAPRRKSLCSACSKLNALRDVLNDLIDGGTA
jgi:hypothetical protein